MLLSNVLHKILGLVKENQLGHLPYTNVFFTGDHSKQKELVYLIALFS